MQESLIQIERTMTRLTNLLFPFLCIFLFTVSLTAQQHIVPDDFTTIQGAIDAASAGDTIMVRAGSYHEFLVMRKDIILRSEGEVDTTSWLRAERTIIHANGLRDGNGKIPPVVNMADRAVLDGFTVTGMDTVNHHLPGHSHAVQNRGVSGIIRHCIVHSNGSTGIGSHDKDGREANPVVIHNKVYRNFGIGIGFNHTSKGIARHNEVFENREVGIGIQNGAAPLILGNAVYNNGWNGISARQGAWPDIISNNVYGNGVDPTGEGAPPSTGAGIGLDSTGWIARPGETPKRMMIYGNEVDENPSGGIMSRNHAIFVAERNHCGSNGNFQISVTDSSDAWLGTNTLKSTDATVQAGGFVIARGGKASMIYNSAEDYPMAGLVVTAGGIATCTGQRVTECDGAGVHVDGADSRLTIDSSYIRDCDGPAFIIEEGTVDIRKSLLDGNEGGGIFHADALVQFINNTVVSRPNGAGRGIAVNGRSGSICYNNIVAGYTVGFYLEENPVIDYNCTYDNQGYNGPPGTGGAHAISADPRFLDASNSEFFLKPDSPCIDAGHPDPQYNDVDGTRADMGAFPYEETTGIKSTAPRSTPELLAYPTVTRDRVQLRITGGSAAAMRLAVYTLLGESVMMRDFSAGSCSVDLSSLPDGIYILHAQRVDGRESNARPLTTRVQLLR